jgi:hypothetical protein
MKDWTKVFSSNDKFEVDVLHAKLKDVHGIECIVQDHQDSAYTMLNTTDLKVHLFVKNEDAQKAKEIISSTNSK